MNAAWDCVVAFVDKERAELAQLQSDRRPLGPREVAGRTIATLISTGTELAEYQGLLRDVQFPIYPGYAAVFEVTELGNEVEGIELGHLAFCMGGHRSWQRREVEHVLPLPEGLRPERAVFARLMGVSMTTLRTTKARPPDLVAVLGLGPIGHLSAKIFDQCGYRVLACDPVSSRRQLTEHAGLKAVPRLPLNDPKVAGHVALVMECSGHEQAVLDGCQIAAKGGEVVLVGVPWLRQTSLFAHDLLYAIFHNYVVVRSGWEWELPIHTQDFRKGSIYDNFAAALEWLAAGRISVEGLYETMSPYQAQNAYQQLLHRQVQRLAVVFDWTKLA